MQTENSTCTDFHEHDRTQHDSITIHVHAIPFGGRSRGRHPRNSLFVRGIGSREFW